MPNLLFQSTDFISKRNLPVLKTIEDVIYVERFEADAYGHWLFLDNTPLVDRVNNRTMSQLPGAASPPVLSLEGVKLVNQVGNGLISDLADDATTNVTQISICKVNASTLCVVQGNLVGTGNTTASGTGVYTSANKALANMKPIVSNNTGALNGTTINQTLALNEFCLIAHCVNKTAKTLTLYVLNNDVENSVTASFTATYEANAHKVGLGNNYYNSGSLAELTIVESIIYNKALTLAEIKAVASRSKIRLANRGIIF